MISYLKNFLLFFTIVVIINGCTSKLGDDNSGLAYRSKDGQYLFQSASLENTIYQRDLRLKKYKELAKTKKKFSSLEEQTFLDDRFDLNLKLFDFYSEWEGVGYKLGGDSKSGIDCSGFIQKAFKEKFDLSMPRTTLEQSVIGKEISKDQLKGGDLVFFKIGDINHVGVYLEDGMFIHASTKIGVTISELDSSYFNKNYWKAQRVIE